MTRAQEASEEDVKAELEQGRAEVERRDQPEQNGQARRASRTLQVRSIREILDELRNAGQRTWLVQRLWPGDAYGVLGAQDKAGKTWGLLDLAVSVASGTPWLGRFPCPNPGQVTMFLGEGGMPGTVRRLEAVAAHKGLELVDLPLRLEFKAPNLGREEHLRFIAEELAAYPPRLMCLDPFYLTTGGRSGTNLNEMGELLASVQALCEDAGSALVVNVHWNKTGTGKGAERFTGVGPSAWGRVLGSASVEQSTVEADGKTTNVTLGWEFKGGEIADIAFRMRRRVWADDPDDLDSPLHYEVEITGEGVRAAVVAEGPGESLGYAQRRVIAAMRQGGKLLKVNTIGDGIAQDGLGSPLKVQTIRNALQGLERLGLVEGSEEVPGLHRHWSLTAAPGDPPDPPDPPGGEGGEGTLPTLPLPLGREGLGEGSPGGSPGESLLGQVADAGLAIQGLVSPAPVDLAEREHVARERAQAVAELVERLTKLAGGSKADRHLAARLVREDPLLAAAVDAGRLDLAEAAVDLERREAGAA
jgi:hypothetical protein